tara:strand:- start:168 stop:620 length:453 start_codon:yes stop_codon:yes gene_type:complete
MDKFIRFSMVLLLLFNSAIHAASLQSLNNYDVMNLVKGNTITTIPLNSVDNGLQNNTFRGYFGPNGKAIGHFSNKTNSQPQQDQGVWTVKSDGSFCITWERWNKQKPVCLLIYKAENGYMLLNQQSNYFEAFILKTKPGDQLDLETSVEH